MCAKLFSGTIYMLNNMIITVKINTFESCKIAWFPWQPIMQFLRMGAYLQNTHIKADTHPRILFLYKTICDMQITRFAYSWNFKKT